MSSPAILVIHRDGKKEVNELFTYGTGTDQLCGGPSGGSEYPGNVRKFRVFGELSEGIVFEECKHADYAVLQKKKNYGIGTLAVTFGQKNS